MANNDDHRHFTNIFNLEQIFSIPLNAVIEANARAAETAVDFIRRYGFVRDSDSNGVDDFGKLRMASFTYDFVGNNGFPQTMTVKIPFLSLIPLPLLEVKNAEFNFAIQIFDLVEFAVKSDEETAAAQPPLVLHDKNVQAMYAPLQSVVEKEREYSMQANMEVRVEVVRADMPAGLLQLMNLGQEATEGQPNNQYTITPDQQQLLFDESNNFSRELTITLGKAGDPDNSENLQGILISVEVISNTFPVDDMFADSIQIMQGAVVGIPSRASASALTTTAGIIQLGFKSYEQVNGNGWVKIKTQSAQPIQVYFNITPPPEVIQ